MTIVLHMMQLRDWAYYCIAENFPVLVQNENFTEKTFMGVFDRKMQKFSPLKVFRYTVIY